MYQDIIQQFGFFQSSVLDHCIITWDISADYEIRPQNKNPIAAQNEFDTQSIPESSLMGSGCLAQRLFLGTGKYNSTAKVSVDMGLQLPDHWGARG